MRKTWAAGVLIIGAQLNLDPETNALEIESADLEGVRLNNVHKRQLRTSMAFGNGPF